MNNVKSGTFLLIETKDMEVKISSVIQTLQLALVDTKERDFLIQEAIHQLQDTKLNF
ncbi:hypothetical protein WKH56_32805 [Priestia sp. SB1]|uniref:hypothetical protein n=1 Tax=Priestia sp. SB1 TaxID=3132359 RepID=UPI0031822FD5